jgi:hypothetical protein
MRSALLLVLLLLLISPIGLEAQGSSSHIAGPSPNPLILRPYGRWGMEQQLALDSVPRDIRPTYWKEGALVGGISLGLGFALLWDSFCRSSDSGGSCGGATTAGFLVGGVLGGLIGALIGGQFPKDPDA